MLMTRPTIIAFFSALLMTCFARAAEPVLSAEAEAKLDAAARAIVESKQGAGIAIGVVRGKQLVFNRAYGSANLEQGMPVTASTNFRLASLTKQFTATAVLLLAEQKKLSLDDKLTKYYAEFPRGNEITLRHLLQHTAGIRDYLDGLVTLPPTEWAHEKLAQRIATLGFDFDPGTAWNYSNSNYYLLGQIIEKVSGQSYGQFLRKNLFEPLSMAETAVDDEAEIVPHRAAGYHVSKDSPSGFINANYIPMSVVYAAGATRSTVSDLAKWQISFFGGKVLSPESFKAMMTEGRLDDGRPGSSAIWRPAGETPRPPTPGYADPMGYTMGLHTGVLDGHRFMGHEGGIFGFSTIIERYVDDDFSLIILANTPRAAGLLEMQSARILFAALSKTAQ